MISDKLWFVLLEQPRSSTKLVKDTRLQRDNTTKLPPRMRITEKSKQKGLGESKSFVFVINTCFSHHVLGF